MGRCNQTSESIKTNKRRSKKSSRESPIEEILVFNSNNNREQLNNQIDLKHTTKRNISEKDAELVMKMFNQDKVLINHIVVKRK